MKKITNIKERILHYVDYKGITRENFFDGLGEITYGSFKGVSKNSALNSNAVAEIVTKYPDLNLTWLITGNGEMLNQNRISRLLLFLKQENIERSVFAEKTTLSSDFVCNLEQFVDLDFKSVKLILCAYPELSQNWLYFGIGDMWTDEAYFHKRFNLLGKNKKNGETKNRSAPGNLRMFLRRIG